MTTRRADKVMRKAVVRVRLHLDTYLKREGSSLAKILKGRTEVSPFVIRIPESSFVALSSSHTKPLGVAASETLSDTRLWGAVAIETLAIMAIVVAVISASKERGIDGNDCCSSLTCRLGQARIQTNYL